MNKNRFLTLLLKAAFLGLLLLFFLKGLEPLFIEAKTSVWQKFYTHKENTVDVLILGNSHANAGFDLDILEAKTNATIASLATQGQNIYQTYYCALEAYNYQTPEVLIIENFLFYERLTKHEFATQDPTLNDYKKRYLTFEGKKLGKVKYEESYEFFEGSLIENMLPALKKHAKWSEIEDLKKRLNNITPSYNKPGISILSQEKVLEYETLTNFDLMEFNILPDEQEALDKIVTLAKQKGTKHIILYTIPFYEKYRNKIDYASLHKPLFQFSSAFDGITYIDLNTVYPDWDNTYFVNDAVGYNQHLNYKGAIEVSNHLASIISQKNKFPKKTIVPNTVEFYLYNKIKKETLPNGNKMMGNLETINSSKEINYISSNTTKWLKIKGWMAIENIKSKNYEMAVAFVKDSNYIFISQPNQLKNTLRRDVTSYHKKEPGFYDASGFEATLNSKLLEQGLYKIYMVLKDEKGQILIKDSFKTVTIE
ncbi:MAG: hypothetical protein R2781_00795 [Flavobacteriaceae bacterium]